jgi:hypoxanthine-guanine phosphoribosyltransferase
MSVKWVSPERILAGYGLDYLDKGRDSPLRRHVHTESEVH